MKKKNKKAGFIEGCLFAMVAILLITMVIGVVGDFIFGVDSVPEPRTVNELLKQYN